MPTRPQRKNLTIDLPARIAPVDFNAQRIAGWNASQTKVAPGAALPRGAITTVDLRAEPFSICEINHNSCADRGSPQSIRAGMASTRRGPRWIVYAKRQ